MITDDEIMRALVQQVTKAAAGGPEHLVRTYITPDMYSAWSRAVGPGSIYGSLTTVIDGPGMRSVSFIPRP